MKSRRLLRRAQTNPAALRFNELEALALAFGFELVRITGSHHIFAHPAVLTEILNVQPDKIGMGKAYQVRQLIKMIKDYDLTPEDDER
ncbi:MAG: type II toxin-antitoxin system HicA family toxin [Thermomicrobiales bacterium]